MGLPQPRDEVISVKDRGRLLNFPTVKREERKRKTVKTKYQLPARVRNGRAFGLWRHGLRPHLLPAVCHITCTHSRFSPAALPSLQTPRKEGWEVGTGETGSRRAESWVRVPEALGVGCVSGSSPLLPPGLCDSSFPAS